MKDYLAGGTMWLYPRAGDPAPPLNTKILLLTEGGVAVVGHWYATATAWHPLPLRNKIKDELPGV